MPLHSTSVGSALFEAADSGEATIYAIFGGQGNTEDYFSELREIYNTHQSLVEDVLLVASKTLKSLAQNTKSDQHDLYAKGLDVMEWLLCPQSTPSSQYMLAAPISVPLIGLTQLLQYTVLCKKLSFTPGEFLRRLSGTTGHSQGIVIATVIATAQSWDSFLDAAISGLKILFSIGYRTQLAFPRESILPSDITDSIKNGEGSPTPMMAISELSEVQVERHLDEINRHFPEDRRIVVALVNGPQNTVVSGHPKSLHGLAVSLRKRNVHGRSDQSRIPFSQRKDNVQFRYLPTTVPFHSNNLMGASIKTQQDLQNITLDWKALQIPVYDARTGTDLRRGPEENLVPALVQMITVGKVDWPRALNFSRATHIIDFGPGGLSGAGILTHRIKDGTGIRVLLAGVASDNSKDFGYQSELLSKDLNFGVNWYEKFKPRLVKTSAGTTYIDTKLSRLLGLPPIMVAGMTPTTVAWDFVAATMNANYHIELAGGGYFNAKDMMKAMVKIRDAIPPGRDISINLIYASPAAMQWQIQMIRDLQTRDAGINVAGLTIGAGVPSIEVATNYIETLNLSFIAFKPSSIQTIQRVIDIAQAHSNFPIMLQWTGGRGGGHHSFEDFHEPILRTYSAIRKCDNIILVAGSGFGGSEDTYPYLNGSWSEMLGYPPMPFDGFLLGSRVMTAKEAHTSRAAKDLLVKTNGVADTEWERTYKGPAGGIITVISEMGEPIHTVATRGMIFWAEMDKKIFSLEKSKRVAALQKQRAYVIQGLNTDFQKPWFGNIEGMAVDLQDMTYGQVVRRMIQLMFIQREFRWIDKSYKIVVGDFLRRVEERFAQCSDQPSLLPDYAVLDNKPIEKANNVLRAYRGAENQLMNAEDVQYFLQVCRRPKQKPVPFIPVLDEDFETWFKKDSLWQSEDLDAVIDQDAERTCILQGPVAVKHSKVVNEPVKDILDSINTDHIHFLTEELHCGRSATIPACEYFFGTDIYDPPSDDQYTMINQKPNTVVYSIPLLSTNPLPSTSSWLHLLAGPSRSCRHALFMSDKIIQDSSQRNPFRSIFSPKRGTKVEIEFPCKFKCTTISLKQEIQPGQFFLSLLLQIQPNNKILVKVVSQKTSSGLPASLSFHYTYHPETGYAPIWEMMSSRTERINDFYRRCWFGGDDNAAYDMVSNPEIVTINCKEVEAFLVATNNNQRSSIQAAVPMSYAIKIAWKPILKALFRKAVRGDLLKLVHLSNTYTRTPRGPTLKVGQKVEVSADVVAILNQASGKTVSIRANIMLNGESSMEVLSKFFYRGTFDDFENTIEKQVESPREIVLGSSANVAVLKSKLWFQPERPEFDLLGLRLVFRLESIYRFKDEHSYSEIRTFGSVTLEIPSEPVLLVGKVDFSSGHSLGNEVMDYLDRVGSAIQQPIQLGHPIPLHGASPLLVKMPLSNTTYASASGDLNPIHIHPVFSEYANLPGTITHGMYVSAVMQGLVETYAADNVDERVKMFQSSFVGMVLPEDELEVELFHTSMIEGCRVIKVEAKNKETGEKVFSGEANVGPPVTAYIFTGQGSQEVGMGMDLYATSAPARKIWDEADKYLSDTFGFLITDIVRKNPKELTIYFRGRRGRIIRENYMKLTHDVYDQNGNIRSQKLFPQINEFSTSYTYMSATGLLFSTQFAQPALTVAVKAIIDDMLSKGLIYHDSIFAGHSLGEYSALAAMGNIIPVERLVFIVFYRGLTMQHSLERDENGRSNFAMVAVDPSRISPSFNEVALKYVVDSIVRSTGEFLQIVNYNVEGKQYVCTGNLQALDCLMELTDTVKKRSIDLATFLSIMPLDQINETFDPMVKESFSIVDAKPKPLVLKRGSATIPLPGIDLPFHSSYFVPRLNSFRSILLRNLEERTILPEKLIGRYIPNLTAKPFSIDKEYFEEVYQLTGSERIKAVLETWDEGEVLKTLPEV